MSPCCYLVGQRSRRLIFIKGYRVKQGIDRSGLATGISFLHHTISTRVRTFVIIFGPIGACEIYRAQESPRGLVDTEGTDRNRTLHWSTRNHHSVYYLFILQFIKPHQQCKWLLRYYSPHSRPFLVLPTPSQKENLLLRIILQLHPQSFVRLFLLSTRPLLSRN